MMDFTRPKWSCQCSYTVVEDAISSHMPAEQSVKNCNMDLKRRMLHRKQVIKAYMAEHQADFETCNASRMMHSDLSTPKSDSQKASHRGRHLLQCSTPSEEEGTLHMPSMQGENLVVNNKLKFNSCRFESSITGDHAARFTGSSSFRSVNSGYWESGPDKDITESCSSSRDSNGSSMDSTHLHDSNTESSSSSSSSSSSLTSSAPIFSSSRRRTANVNNFLPWKSFFHHLVIRAPRWQRIGCKADFNSDGGMQRLRGSLMNHRNMGKIAPRSEDGKRRSIVGFEYGGKSSREGGGESKGDAGFENGGKSKNGEWIEACEFKGNVEDGKGYVKGTENEKWCLEGRQAEEKNLKMTTTKKKKQQKKKKKGRWVLPKEQAIESNCKQQQQPKGGGESNRRIYARTMDEANGGLVKLDEEDHEGNAACELQSHKITLPRKPWPLSHGHFVTKKQGSIMSSHHQYHLHGIAHHLMSFPFSAQSLPIPSRKDHAPPQPTSHYSSLSTMHELHCSLQSAIAHCKQSNTQQL